MTNPQVRDVQLVQGWCISCDRGIEWGTGKACPNGCTYDNHKNPPKEGQFKEATND